jgi:hypothetical protein
MIKIISHRGNLNGKDPLTENQPLQVDLALNEGFDVEVDLWMVNDIFFLGHDRPEYKIDLSWLSERSFNLWIHCKNIESIDFLSSEKIKLNFFFHQNDHLTLTSNLFLWVFPGMTYSKNSVLVSNNIKDFNITNKNPFAICTDFPLKLRKNLYDT